MLAGLPSTFAQLEGLGHHVRQSPVCDDQLMPRMFVEQLEQMFRQTLNA